MNHPRAVWAARLSVLAAVIASIGIRADGAQDGLDDPVIQQYIARQTELTDQNTALVAQADAETRSMTAAERQTLTENCDEWDRLENDIQLRLRLQTHQSRADGSQGRRTPPGSGDRPDDQALQNRGDGGGNGGGNGGQQQQPQRQQPHVQTRALTQPGHRAAMRGNHGFLDIGGFCRAVMFGSMKGGTPDPRLQMASATTVGSEAIGADGGFAVPPDFAAAIQVLVNGEASLLSMCDTYPTSSNRVTVPTDETTPWGTTGVRAFWAGEQQAYSQSKPNLRDHTTVLSKLTALVPLSDELTSDSPMMSTLVTRKAGDAIVYALNNALINGTGIAQPLGILNSPCLVSQAAEASQVTATVHGLNIINMWGRVPGAVRNKCVWLCNQDVEVQLMKLGLQIGPAAAGAATGGQLIYMPPGGLSGQPYGTLLGRPIITTEACKTIGTLGDIVLAFMGGYFAPVKGPGPQGSISLHLWFDQDLVAYKWTMRVGGQPWLQAPIARASGNNTLSHFVALAAR